MFGALIICIITAALSMFFWVLEGRFGFLAVKDIPHERFGDWMLYLPRFIVQTPKFIYLIIDVGATVMLVSMFDMGGMIGTAMGLTMSDVLSIALWFVYGVKKKPSHNRMEYQS